MSEFDGWQSGWLRTWTGKKFYPKAIEESPVDILDIAHALANMNRYNGHLGYFYSVAQHSILVEQILQDQARRSDLAIPVWVFQQALLHDAAEAYMPDMPSPWKDVIAGWREIEARVQIHVFKAFDLPVDIHPRIHEIDKKMRGSEISCLAPWSEHWAEDEFKIDIAPWPHDYAKDRFLKRYNELWRPEL